MRSAKDGERMKDYIIAIDQSTSASKVFLVDENGRIVKRCTLAHRQSYPQPGYAEHDAEEIWRNVLTGIRTVAEGVEPERIAAISISNQRETTVLWDRADGKPVMPAIVWQDVRAEALCAQMQAHAELVKARTGLDLSAYYPAAKAMHALRNNPELYERAKNGEICIGTIDSFLIFRMTEGKVFGTDVSNASRTSLMNLETLGWDEELCELFGIPMDCLARILPSDGDFGTMAENGLPITGVMGDSHAALFGQGCLVPGMTKATFGTGSSVMMNVGKRPVYSTSGLSACVGFGFAGSTHYVLEGNITCSGDTLIWLRDEAQMVDSVDEVETIAKTVSDTNGVYLVPAFSGLGAPYFDGKARAALIGMNRGTTRAHIVRAALESMAYQDADVLLAMERDTGRTIDSLHADGGPAGNALLMQMMSDLAGCSVRCTEQSELSALGTAYMAGLATGVYASFESIPAVSAPGKSYHPAMPAETRKDKLAAWQDAVRRCR